MWRYFVFSHVLGLWEKGCNEWQWQTDTAAPGRLARKKNDEAFDRTIWWDLWESGAFCLLHKPDLSAVTFNTHAEPPTNSAPLIARYLTKRNYKTHSSNAAFLIKRASPSHTSSRRRAAAFSWAPIFLVKLHCLHDALHPRIGHDFSRNNFRVGGSMAKGWFPCIEEVMWFTTPE